jgi:Tfp pilus assembly protein PilV
MFKSKDALYVIVAVLVVVIGLLGIGWCQAEMEEGDTRSAAQFF